jgi:hypothetical protein
MDARVEVHKLIDDGDLLEKVDKVFFDLVKDCPQEIIEYFNRPK